MHNRLSWVFGKNAEELASCGITNNWTSATGEQCTCSSSAISTGEIFLPSLSPLVAQLVKNLLAIWENWVRSLGWEDPLEKAKATQCSILAWRIPWLCSPSSREVSDVTERLSLSLFLALGISACYQLAGLPSLSRLPFCNSPLPAPSILPTKEKVSIPATDHLAHPTWCFLSHTKWCPLLDALGKDIFCPSLNSATSLKCRRC